MSSKPKYNYNSYIGKNINYLNILEVLSKDKKYHFKCKCLACGKILQIRASSVISETTKSCGCKREELISITHILPDNQMLINSIYNRYKQRSFKKNLKFNITKDEFVKLIMQNCVYCGREPEKREFITNRKDSIISIYCHGIDRIDNNYGYIENNCATCCKQCNQSKSNYSLKEFKEWVDAVYNNFNTKH